MKKITIILSAIITGLFTACTSDDSTDLKGGTAETTTVTFSVSFASDGDNLQTRAMADKPQVQNLYLAVFNNDGKALVEYVKADPEKTELATENGTAYKYTAKLTISDQPRVIHFIANGPDELPYGSEEDAVGSLVYSFDKTTWKGQDAYWGYLELPDGICSASSSGYSNLTSALSNVVLIRNFAKIQVESATGSNLTITRFWINNFPEQSSIAPYNRDGREFETAYASYTSASAAVTAGYTGFCPASSGLVSISGLGAPALSLAQYDANETAYIYEREAPVKDPMCIIVGGTSDLSSTETFYKIDLRDADGKYIPILRNFVYKVSIGKVEKVGESTVEAAINSVAPGSIDTNLELQDLTNISNGTSKITVNKTEQVIFSNDPEELIYQFIPNIAADDDGDGKADIVNTTLEQLLNMGFANEEAVQAAHLSYVKITRENGASGAVFTTNMKVDDNDTEGSRHVFLQPDDAMNGVPRTETITVTGYYYNPAPEKEKYETLTRTIKYQIRPRLEFYLKLNPNMVKGDSVGQAVNLTIGIEENLPSSIFTLDLTVIARNMSVTPVNKDLPIKTEIIDGKPVFCFTRAITWKEYNEAPTYQDEDGVIRKHFTCEFKTNTTEFLDVDKGNNPNQGEYFMVEHKYFEDAAIELYTGDLDKYRFKNMHFDKEYIVPGRTANYTFSMSALPDDGTVYISVKNLTSSVLTPATGVSDPDQNNADFTVYELPVSKLTETIALTPTSDSRIAYIKPFDSQFNPVRAIDINIHPLQFSDLRLVNLADEGKDYLVGARTARISFHLDEMPTSANQAVTVKLTNLAPVSTTPGTGMTNITSITDKGSGVYEIVPSSQDITIDVTPAVGDNITAKYELSNAEFENNSCSSVIKKLSFTNVKLLNMANITSDHVIGGKTARVYFTLEDMPTSANQAITLTLTNLTPVNTTVGNGMTNITSITEKGSGVYEIVASDNNVTLDVIPTGGQTAASFTIANTEFYNGASGNVPIQKLSFLNPRLINTNDPTKTYVVGGKPAYISFSLEDMPSSANQSITLTMTNLTPVSTDLTSGEMTGISSFSGSAGSYTFVPSGKNITINVTPTAGDNLKASYSLSNTEFKTTGNGVSNVNINKLTFSNLKFTYPTGKTYLLAGGQASITFSVDQLPSDPDNKVTLYIKNATLTGLTLTGTSGDFKTYSVPVDSKTKTLNITVASGVTEAEFYLSDNEFYTMTTAQHAKADIKTTYTIDWSKVQIKTDNPNAEATGQTVKVYRNDATCSGTPIASFTTDGSGMASGADYVLDAANGTTDKFYFKFTKNNDPNSGVDYISDAVNLGDIANKTSTVTVTCKIQMITYKIAAGKLYFTRADDAAVNGKEIKYSTSDGKSGSFTSSTTGYNPSELSFECKPGTTITFSYSQNANHQGKKTVNIADIADDQSHTIKMDTPL